MEEEVGGGGEFGVGGGWGLMGAGRLSVALLPSALSLMQSRRSALISDDLPVLGAPGGWGGGAVGSGFGWGGVGGGGRG